MGIYIVIFFIGITIGFLLASLLIGWYAKETETDKQRLQLTVMELREEIRQYQIAAHDETKCGRLGPSITEIIAARNKSIGDHAS